MSIICMSLAATGSNQESKMNAEYARVGIVEEKTTYTSNGQSYDAYVTYDKNIEGKRPGVLVLPEWWGLNEYSRSRAKQLAELGYAAMALDVYGNGRTGDNPDEAAKLADPYYKNPALAKVIMDAALEKFKTYSQVDDTKMAAIGYCFGGGLVLNAAKLGIDLKGVVSFHGGLAGVKPDKEITKAKILVCHGAADEFEIPNVATFKIEMDASGVDYTWKEYAGAQHAFTNPNATERGERFKMPISYNIAADKASWEDMKKFFKKIFE